MPPRMAVAIGPSRLLTKRHWRRRRSPSRPEPVRQIRPMQFAGVAGSALFDLRFLEDDVLARHRVKLFQLELIGLRPRVLLGHVEIPRIGTADQLDENGIGLRHWRSSRGTILALGRR